MRVREYKEEDYEGLVSLYKDTATYGGSYDESRDSQYRLLKTSEEGNLIVAVCGESISGSMMFLSNAHSFWITRFVLAHKSSSEVAEALLREATKTARNRSHESMIVYTDSADENLHDRYYSLGFNGSSQYQCFWKEVK